MHRHWLSCMYTVLLSTGGAKAATCKDCTPQPSLIALKSNCNVNSPPRTLVANQSRSESIRLQLLFVFAWKKRDSSTRSVALHESTRCHGQGHDLVLLLYGICLRIGTCRDLDRDVGELCRSLCSVLAPPFLSFVGLVLLESP